MSNWKWNILYMKPLRGEGGDLPSFKRIALPKMNMAGNPSFYKEKREWKQITKPIG
jgi:hypothetical protein